MTKKEYEVFWTATAQDDLCGIIDYISRDSIDKASAIFNRLKKKAEDCAIFPLKGRVVPELKFFNIEIYREIIENPWRIIYRIDDHTVYIIAVFDGRRNLEDVLLERLVRIE